MTQHDITPDSERPIRSLAQAERDPHDYTLEVCVVCGAQLDRYRNGRCPVDRRHWPSGGKVVQVVLADEAETLRAGINWARGMLTDVERPDKIDAFLGGLLQ